MKLAVTHPTCTCESSKTRSLSGGEGGTSLAKPLENLDDELPVILAHVAVQDARELETCALKPP